MKLQEILGTRYPLIAGGMANISTGTFAAAVSEGGGLGLIASGSMDAQQVAGTNPHLPCPYPKTVWCKLNDDESAYCGSGSTGDRRTGRP